MKDPFEELVGVRGTTAASAGVSQTQTASARNVTSFQDLLSAPNASGRSATAAPNHPDGLGENGSQFHLEVDGVPQSLLDFWFELADADKDGRVANTEAVEFFLQTGLSPIQLRQIYLMVKTPERNAREGVGLSKFRFAQMLRVIALAQSGLPFTEETAAAAMSPDTWMAWHGQPLPPPRVHLKAVSPAGISPASGQGNTLHGGAGVAVAVSPAPQKVGAAHQEPTHGNPFTPAAPAAAAPGTAAHSQSSAPLGGAGVAGWDPLDVSLLQSVTSRTSQQAQQQGEQPQPATPDALAWLTPTQPTHPAPPSGDVVGAMGGVVIDDDDIFGLKKLSLQSGQHAPAPAAAGAAPVNLDMPLPPKVVKQLSRSTNVSKDVQDQEQQKQFRRAGKEVPLAFDVRLPPLNPDQSAKLSMLAAGNGSLFAGPGNANGILQWSRPEGNLQPALAPGAERRQSAQGLDPLDGFEGQEEAEGQCPMPTVLTEDADAAPSAEVQVTPRKSATCMLVDTLADMLWVADKEGVVSGFDISGQPGEAVTDSHHWPPLRQLYQWEAYRVGMVASMCVTPGGELWTASSRGNIRVWRLQQSGQSSGRPNPEPLVCRELRRPHGERPHTSAVLSMVCTADGQLVWTASSKNVLLWDAASGSFMGILHKVMGKLGTGLVLDHAVTGAEALLKYNISPLQGLDVDPATGAVLQRPSSGDRSRLQAEQTSWASQSDKSMREFVELVSMGGKQVVQGAGKAMKIIGKFGAKVGRKFGGPDAPETPAKLGPYSAVLEEEQASMKASGSFNDKSGRLCGLVASPGGHVCLGYSNGRVDQYTAAGKLIWSKEMGGSLRTMCCVGRNLWLGFASGWLNIVDSEGHVCKAFPAHCAGIISIAQAGTRTYTLAADGSIRGWSSALPHPADTTALDDWDVLASSCIRQDTLHMLCVTWNVGESKPPQRSPFFTRLHGKVNITNPGTQLVVVGLQEIEMGGSSVAMAAAKDVLSYRMQERGNQNAKFWGAAILDALGADLWYQVALRQLSGMLVLVYARNTLKNCIGEVTTTSVACGVLGVGGNKGAVAAEFTVHRLKVAAISSHFAAHQKAVKERNANYEQILKQLTFKRRPWFAQGAGGEEAEGEGEGREAEGGGRAPPQRTPSRPRPGSVSEIALMEEDLQSEDGCEGLPVSLEAEELIQGEGMRQAKLLVWLGDFNYRIDGPSYLDAKEMITRESWDELLEKDQLRQQWAVGAVFRGLSEGPIQFRPTYKFDVGDVNPEAYDSSEKLRVPSWCDRVFFRGSLQEEEMLPRERVVVTSQEYNCWLDVLDSDHKPVFSRLEVTLPVTNHEKKRHICSQLLKRCAAEAQPSTPSALEQLALSCLPHPLQGVSLKNRSKYAARFVVRLDTAAADVLDRTVDVLPVTGMVLPGREAAIHVMLGTLGLGGLQHSGNAAQVAVEPEGGWDPREAANSRWVEGQVVVMPELSRGSQYAAERSMIRQFRVVWPKQ